MNDQDPKTILSKTVFRVIDRDSGETKGSYNRAYGEEYDFDSADQARGANVHDLFKDKEKYKIAKYKVTYTLIEDDCD